VPGCYGLVFFLICGEISKLGDSFFPKMKKTKKTKKQKKN
jgi:hypothetical protein